MIRTCRFLINDENEDGNTPLHLASLQGKEEVVEVLLNATADVEARNTVLWTPLDCASAFGHVNVCRLLLDYDAPLDPLDKVSWGCESVSSRAWKRGLSLFLGRNFIADENNSVAISGEKWSRGSDHFAVGKGRIAFLGRFIWKKRAWDCDFLWTKVGGLIN